MICMMQLYNAFLDALPFANVSLANAFFCVVHAIDVIQPREFFIEAYIAGHAIVICLRQRRLG